MELQAWGFSDPKPLIGRIIVDGIVVAEARSKDERGLHVVLLKREPLEFWKCSVIANSYRHFDPWMDKIEGEKLREYIEQQSSGTIILLMSADEVTGRDKGMQYL